MFKKVSSLLLCGLISFSLFGMALPQVFHCDNTGQPIQPSKMEKLKAHVKIIAPLGLSAGTLGFLGGTVLIGLVNLSRRIIRHPFESDLQYMVGFTATSLAAMGLLYCGGIPLMNYSQNQRNIAWRRNIIISQTSIKSFFWGGVICGLAAGLYTVNKLNNYFLHRG